MKSLDKQIMDALREYTTEVTEGIEEAIEDVAKESKKKWRDKAPKRTGAYKKSLRLRKENKSGKYSFTVHASAPHYRLTHLLEDGHRTKNGGFVSARPHIRQIEDWALKEAERRIEEVLKG